MPRKYQKNKPTQFETTWGVSPYEFAVQEDVLTETIYMRVCKYGTPFQRKAKPTVWERVYAKTVTELAIEMQMHPQSLYIRHKKQGNIYIQKPRRAHNRGIYTQGWVNSSNYRDEPWLCEQHPDYELWRSGEMFPDDYIKSPE